MWITDHVMVQEGAHSTTQTRARAEVPRGAPVAPFRPLGAKLGEKVDLTKVWYLTRVGGVVTLIPTLAPSPLPTSLKGRQV